MEDHCAMWQETMFAHYGRKWVSLNRSPMWQYDEEVQDVTKSNAGCDILAEALRSSGVHMDDVSKSVPEFESGSSSVVGNEAEAFTQNAEDDDLVPVSRLIADTCFVVEENMSLPCEHREVSSCECEDVADEEPEHVLVSPVFNEASAAVQSHGSEPVAVSTLWSSLSGADIAEINESSDSPFLVEQFHGVTPQKHTVKNQSVLYKPEKVNIVITAKMSIDCGCTVRYMYHHSSYSWQHQNNFFSCSWQMPTYIFSSLHYYSCVFDFDILLSTS